ncbi:MAG TPA: DUF1843 domain-containing protein [Bryobacteraceae bacterium]
MAEDRVAVPLYAPPIYDAIAKGDLARMKQLATEAEQHLQKAGDLRSVLEHLKIEIAKHEHKAKK